MQTDIKGKEYLRGKYYIVDIGLRNYLLGFRDGDSKARNLYSIAKLQIMQ